MDECKRLFVVEDALVLAAESAGLVSIIKRRHCGVCAACMLRRLSVHAAGLRRSEGDLRLGRSFSRHASRLERLPPISEKKDHARDEGIRDRRQPCIWTIWPDMLDSPRTTPTLDLAALSNWRSSRHTRRGIADKLDRMLAAAQPRMEKLYGFAWTRIHLWQTGR